MRTKMNKWGVRLGATVFVVAVAFTLKGQAPTQGPVTSERLLKAADEPGNWLMYSHNYSSWRFSSLDQINAQNVKNLHVKWIFQGRHVEKFETTPLVANGIMYLTRPENAIYALDAATGRQLWSYEYRNPARTYNCCGKVNRGLAMLGNTLFMNTLDMHVVAVDARSGHEIWKTEMGDYTAAGGYAARGAPLVVGDKLIVGMAGGAIPGRPAASPPGTTDPTMPKPTRSSGAPAIPGRITTMTLGWATTFIRARCWRSIPTPGS
jgi:alcohol dehydrogenase (cytochrome c)